MIPVRRLAHLIALAVAAAMLSGCISLLPKSKPVQLYRFDGRAAAPAPASPPATQRVGIAKSIGGFARGAGGDRILTFVGAEAAYIADARWVAPASNLFDDAVNRAFDANRGPARLVSRGEVGQTDYVLRLDVRDFEAIYESGSKAAPTVVVRLRAVLTRGADRGLIGEEVFEARVKAGDDRVSAIVDAYDRAVGEVLTKLVGWTNGLGKPSA